MADARYSPWLLAANQGQLPPAAIDVMGQLEDGDLSPEEAQALAQNPVQRAPAMAIPTSENLPPEMARKLASYNDMAAQEHETDLAQQQNQLQGLQDSYSKMEKAPQGLNYAPLAAFADSVTGSKLSNAIGSLKYESPEEKQAKLISLQEKIAALQNNQSKSSQAYLKSQIASLKAGQVDPLDREKKLAYIQYLKGQGARADEKMALGPELKDPQVQSATYGKRLQQAEDVFNNLSGQGYNRASTMEGLKAFAGQGPLEQLKPDNLKQWDQAERNFVNAILRKESGAAISAGEFDSAEKQYFPRAGDSEDLIAQKKANRQQALEGMKLGSGRAWDRLKAIPGAPSPKAPKPGVVIDGHKFLGGDPANPASWSK